MPHKTSERGRDFIKSFEGLSLSAYPDPGTGGDPWTIGFGTTKGVKPGMKISQAEADELFLEDVEEFENGVNKLVGSAPTSQGEFDAMVSLSYNIGLSNFAKSTVLKRHRLGNRLGASRAFVLWNRAGGNVMAGLTRRREAEAKIYLS